MIAVSLLHQVGIKFLIKNAKHLIGDCYILGEVLTMVLAGGARQAGASASFIPSLANLVSRRRPRVDGLLRDRVSYNMMKYDNITISFQIVWTLL